MAKKCIECGKKKGIFAYNYVGFVVQRDRKIEPHVLPGDRYRDFLCVECANKIKFVCKKHGEVKGRIRVGLSCFARNAILRSLGSMNGTCRHSQESGTSVQSAESNTTKGHKWL